MSEGIGIETRSRSRSKTPGPMLSENGDGDKKGSKKIPTVSLIEEEDDVIEVPVTQPTPTQSSQRSKRQRRSAKVVTSDYSSPDISQESSRNSQKQTEIVKETAAIVNSSSTSTKTSVTTVTTIIKQTNGSEESKSEQASSTTKTLSTKSSTSNAEADVPESQSIFNTVFNAIKTSTPILSNKRSKRITQEVSLTGINVNEHPAYKEYKEAGEYWNKYPKTDYTYSELSPHRRVLGSGVVAMPNMSRRSLDKHQSRVEAMIQNNPAEESFLRRKFLSNSSFQKKSAELQYDSADEVDVSELRRNLELRRKPSSNVISQFFLMIVSYLYSAYYSVKMRVRSVFYYRSNERYLYTPIRKNPSKFGIFGQVFESMKKFVLLGFSKVYLFISTVLCLDTWLLYTRSENNVENRKRKRFLLGLLILLPLLLLGGTYIYLDPPQNISFPKITLPSLRLPKLPKLTLPSLPKISWPEISLPAWFKWPEFSMPTWVKWPEFSFPTISWPLFSIPAWFTWPSFSLPAWFKWPEFSIPAWFKLPEISLPTINWPKISLPEWSFPNISLPSLSLPSINFNLSQYTGYIAEKFDLLKVSSFELFEKVRDATTGLLNEAQIVWNENFNINSK